MTLELIKAGANINIQAKDRWTPLLAACSLNHPELVRILVEHGADPREKGTFFREDAFAVSARNGASETLYTLIEIANPTRNEVFTTLAAALEATEDRRMRGKIEQALARFS